MSNSEVPDAIEAVEQSVVEAVEDAVVDIKKPTLTLAQALVAITEATTPH
jgi:hypothetical protein